MSTAAEVFSRTRLGWNLGNSLDAPEGETAWGNPLVNETLINSVAAAGFELVRVPVTWSLHLGPAPDYVIDAVWLERVAEVVDWVLAAEMVAVINLHHDGADDYEGVEWLTLNDADAQVTESNNQRVREQFSRLWEQLADRFGGCGESLLFESMNEIHDGYDAPDPAYYTIINDLNQTFVDIVRASSDNNAARTLIVPGYNTNIDYTLEGFAVPSDTASDRLALSVHYYDPWSFAGEGSTPVWGAASPGTDDWGQEDFVVTQFDRLKERYVDQGVPVMMGEFGAVRIEGYETYRRYYLEYVTKAAVDRGITPVYWDNGGLGSGPDSFGLFNRESGEVVFAEMVDALLRGATEAYSLTDIAPP